MAAEHPLDDGTLAAIYELAHSEATRALDGQLATIEALRLRAGLSLSAGVVVLTALGSQRLPAEGVGLGGWMAIAAFALAGCAALAVLWPRQWESQVAAKSYVTQLEASDDVPPLASVHRDLALEKELARRDNEPAVVRLIASLRIAYMLWGAQVLALLTELV